MNPPTPNDKIELRLTLPADLVARADRLVESGDMPSREAVMIAALEAYLAASVPSPRVAEARAQYLAGELEAERWPGEAKLRSPEDEARWQAEMEAADAEWEAAWTKREAEWQAELAAMEDWERNGWPDELTPEMIEYRMKVLEENFCMVNLDNPELAHDIATNPLLSEFNLDWELYGLEP